MDEDIAVENPAEQEPNIMDSVKEETSIEDEDVKRRTTKMSELILTTNNDNMMEEEVDQNNENLSEYIEGVANSNEQELQHDDLENDELNNDEEFGVTKKPKRERVSHDVALNCPKCRFKCFSKTGMINHMRMHIDREAGVVKLTCALCTAYFDTNEQLVAHKEVHSGEHHSFICAKCKLAFTDHLDWQLHRLQHTHRKYYKCEECHKFFKAKYAYKEHLAIHYDRKLSCGICAAVVPSERALRQHAARHARALKVEVEPDMPPPPEKAGEGGAGHAHRCGECPRGFSSASGLRRHMQRHTGVAPIQCLYCGKGCATEQSRRVHSRVHSNERPYACTTCPQRFKQEADLYRHWCKNGNKQKTIQCGVCQKTFKTDQGLKMHMLLHSEYRPFECAECPQKFAVLASLKHHVIYKHTTDKPYVCDECGKGFKMQAALNKHKRGMFGCDKHRKRTHPELYY